MPVENTSDTADRPVRVAVSLGDPGGIGPEVTLKSLAQLGDDIETVLVGSSDVLVKHAVRLGYHDKSFRTVTGGPLSLVEDEHVVLDVTGGEEVGWAFGAATPGGGRVSMQAVERAVDLCLSGRVDAMVTAPISKAAIRQAGYDEPGHTEFIAKRTDAGPHAMMMVAGGLRVALVTGHMPIAQVAESVTKSAVTERIGILAESLQRDFGIDAPRIAVLGLNPHAGDDGVLGREEQNVITPALEEARSEGAVQLDGPFPADGFFGLVKQGDYDAVLAMYHDQGLVPFKTLAFEEGVNFTAGLPLVRTSPDHGTAYDIAGEGAASPGSMTSALRLAAQVARARSGL